MDFADYRPAPHILEQLRNVGFVAVVGPTAVGKTTVMRAAATVEPILTMVLTTTSRAPRQGEQDGVDYHFRTEAEMSERIAKHEYVQVAPSLLGEIYATAPEDYPTDGIAMMAVLADTLGAFHALPFKSFRSIFVVPPDWQEWQARIRAHDFRPDQLARRLAEARRSLAHALTGRGMLFVVNDDINTAALDFAALAIGEPVSPRLLKDQQRAKTIINDILQKL